MLKGWFGSLNKTKLTATVLEPTGYRSEDEKIFNGVESNRKMT